MLLVTVEQELKIINKLFQKIEILRCLNKNDNAQHKFAACITYLLHMVYNINRLI